MSINQMYILLNVLKEKNTNKIPTHFIFIGQLKCQEWVWKGKIKIKLKKR